MFGKEAALFCPSGTMTNQIAIKVHTTLGRNHLRSQFSHLPIRSWRLCFHSGVAVFPIEGTYGKITPQQIEAAIRPKTDWFPTSSLVVLENSTNKGGGNYYTIDEIKAIYQSTRAKDLKLHLDGARIFNVLVETGENTLELGQYFDSISICLSKGLGAPWVAY